MASDPENLPKLTGLSKHFNSFTTYGRSNIAMVTLGSLVGLILYFKLKPSKK